MWSWLRSVLSPADPRKRVELVASAAPGDVLRREFPSTVVGVTFVNHDATLRQTVIRQSVSPGMTLTLRFEESPFDRNSVAVVAPDGRQIGYLSRSLAAEVRYRTHDGERITVTATAVTGGTLAKPIRGVNLWIRVTASPIENWPGRRDLAKTIAEHKRAGDDAEIEALLLRDIDRREASARSLGVVTSAWPYEQLAILYRRQKRSSNEVSVLRRYCSLPAAQRVDQAGRLERRLARIGARSAL